MKRLLVFLLLFTGFALHAQQAPLFFRQMRNKIMANDTAAIRKALFPGPPALQHDSIGSVYLYLAQAEYFFAHGQDKEGFAIASAAQDRAEKTGIDSLKGFAAFRLGMFYFQHDALPRSLQLLNRYILLYPENLLSSEQVECRRSIALINSYLGNRAESQRIYRWLLRAAEAQHNDRLYGSTCNNIGVTFLKSGQPDSARAPLEKALAIFHKINYDFGVGQVTNNLGTVHFKKAEYPEALENFKQGLEIRTQAKVMLSGLIESRINIGKTYFKLHQDAEARKWLEEAFHMAEYPDGLELRRQAAEQLMQVYAAAGDYKKAFDMQTLYHAAQDSLYGLQKKEEILRITHANDLEQHSREDSLSRAQTEKVYRLERENQLAIDAEKDKKRWIAVSALGVAMLLIASIAFLQYRGNQRKKKDNETIAAQRDALELRQKEIGDSINYARRIQEALLPSSALLQQLMPGHFILFRPRDVVSGDFYWAAQQDGKAYIAVADCTGHGVPGALMSMIGINFLNRIVKEKKVSDPGQILLELHKSILGAFSEQQGSTTVKDGMDIALLCVDRASGTVSYAGAQRPLVYTDASGLHEVGADRTAIGGEKNDEQPFTTHLLQLNGPSTFYLFSDGYADQFGGPKGKKFKFAALKELFGSIAGLEADEQKKRLAENFETWKGQLEQIDDVLVVGVKI